MISWIRTKIHCRLNPGHVMTSTETVMFTQYYCATCGFPYYHFDRRPLGDSSDKDSK